MAIRTVIIGMILAGIGAVAQATENLALIIANENYREFDNADGAFDATDLTAPLRDAGFEVRVIRNMNSRALGRLAPVIRREIDSADRVLVFLSGYIFATSRESWLMTTDAPRTDGLLTGAHGMPIGVLLDMLAKKPGAAIMLVGENASPFAPGAGQRFGYLPRDIGQGVTVFAGRTNRLVTLVADGLLVAGTSIGAAADGAPNGVQVYGYVPSVAAFLPMTGGSGDAPVDELEQLIWDAAKSSATAQAVASYLDRYPDGHFSVQARQLLASVQQSPLEAAREAEQALDLSRLQRRDIQGNLSMLGYNTRGIDGLFGPGTRAAVRRWQADRGQIETGYVSGEQIGALAQQAGRRQLELERDDAQFWRQTGRNGDEDGLRRYLAKYPDGLYAQIARQDLSVFDEERQRDARAAEADAWDQALARDTADGYNAFLHDFPDGTFAPAAQEKLAALRAAENRAAIAEEGRVLANPITRILVEQKLAALGYKPGRVDGRIDDKTRKAVRNFQRAADLPASGYVTQATFARLLAVR